MFPLSKCTLIQGKAPFLSFMYSENTCTVISLITEQTASYQMLIIMWPQEHHLASIYKVKKSDYLKINKGICTFS